MNMKTLIKTLLVIVSLTIISCQKHDGSLQITDLSTAQLKSATIAANDVAVESTSEDANYESYFYSEYENMLRRLARIKGRRGNLLEPHSMMNYINGMGPVVSIDTAATGYPITITIDYGTSIETHNGCRISGKVIVELSGPKNTDGSTRTTTFVDCMVDSVGITGTRSDTFNGDNTTTRKNTAVCDLTFTLPDGTIINRTGNEVREWLQGLDTPFDRSDDKIQTTGTLQVKSTPGDTYTREITTPVLRLGTCFFPVQGTIQYNKNNVVMAVLDYGSGDCDNLATLTTNGATVDIILREHEMPKAKTEGQHEMHKEGIGNGMMGNH